jgi:hypothetical protein
MPLIQMCLEQNIMAFSRIADLPDPVMAAKADWLVASSRMGFTPLFKDRSAVPLAG